MHLSIYNINKNQTNILKGVAMLIIVSHNFLHMRCSIGENEMDFDPERIFLYFSTIANNPIMFVGATFTYFITPAVSLIIFMSGFGLAKKFMSNSQIRYKDYIVPTLKKLYKLILWGILAYIVIYILKIIVDLYANDAIISFNTIFNGISFKYLFKLTVSTLLMYTNLSTDTLFNYVGPWWYFSLAVQLYLLFPLLYHIVDKYNKKGVYGLLIFSFLLIFLLWSPANKIGFPLFANFTGHLPEFILGIGFAKFKEWKITWKILIPITIVYILSNFFHFFFPFNFSTGLLILIVSFYPIYSNLAKETKLARFFYFMGIISMFMFVSNGPLRMLTMYNLGYEPMWVYVRWILHVGVVVGVSYIMLKLYNKTATITSTIKLNWSSKTKGNKSSE